MATLLLQAAGTVVGGLFGPVGAVIGRAVGAAAGYALDSAIFGGDRTVEGARLGDVRFQGSTEGAAVPRLYGRARISGEIIWATAFEEEASSERQGGKGGAGGGGTTVKSYSYFANLAVGLCEGPIGRIGRVWADGKPFDLGKVQHRIYRGTEDQAPDSLIEAKQEGAGAPAYRGLAYVVFQHLPLADFGNRIPQFSFEVFRPAGGIEDAIRAVAVIPGSTEFGYAQEPVYALLGRGRRQALNRTADGAVSDWEASLDEVQAACPNLERAALTVAWYGDDLRAGHCTLKPAVDTRDRTTSPEIWSVAGLTRSTARLVSEFEGRAAFGGTPSDATVIGAIRNLRDRGLKVVFYPFVLMDVPAGNGLPDPHGGAEQAAYPWRGNITGAVAPGRAGTTDQTGAAAAEIASFVGSAGPGDFWLSGDTVHYGGPAEWTFRRLILHAAWLCKAAGGVDAFLLSSELRGLTTLRSDASTFPFVTALAALAADVRTVLGADTLISYGADWSEYFGHHPADGSGDVLFHLDPLWAHGDINFVGLDNYMPLSDWRDGTAHLDAAVWDSGSDTAYLGANVAGGEGFDWYYASDADRLAQTRTPISDGAAGKPWVFRYKDLVAWWSNQHYDRPGGIEAATPTAWVPQGKPIWFTEVGCPAVDKGPNQPNVFPDRKASEGGVPYFSTGIRDDLVQRRFIGATTTHWDPARIGFEASSNPVSAVYGGRMVDPAGILWWAWDARPYPMFPYRPDLWADGENWETGHWLNGRLGALTAGSLVSALLADYGFADAEIGDLDGVIDGYLVGQVMSARQALEPLAGLLLFETAESGDHLRFVRRGRTARTLIGAAALVDEGDRPLLTIRRGQETEIPSEVALSFLDSLADYRPASVHSRRLTTGSQRVSAGDVPAAMSQAVAGGLADVQLQDLWAGRETLSFALPPSWLELEPGDIVRLGLATGERTVLVQRIEDGAARRVESRSIDPEILAAVTSVARILPPASAVDASPPSVLILDLPLIAGTEPAYAPRIAAFADPWPAAVSVAIGTSSTGYPARQLLDRPAVMGELAEPLPAGSAGRWQRGDPITVRLDGGTLASEPELAVLNGANIVAIGSPELGWEVVQFATATLIDTDLWRLEGLLRGQAGTADRAATGHAAGARFVLIEAAVPSLAVTEAESGLDLVVRVGPAGEAFDPDRFSDIAMPTGRRGLRCLPPVRLLATRDGTGVTLSWIRQTRIGGDTWEVTEVPLAESAELYRVELIDGGGPVAVHETAAPELTFTEAELIALFGAVPSALTVRVAQVSPTAGAGLTTEAMLDVR